MVILHFEAQPSAGDLTTGPETTELRYFTEAEIETLPLGVFDRERVTDAFAQRAEPFVR